MTPPVTPVTLSDGNSTVNVDVNSSLGMYGWSVDGVNQLAQQWFWIRAGSTTMQAPINTLSSASYTATANTLTTTYTSSSQGVGVQITYLLTGGTLGSGTSDMQESITVFNNTSSALPVSFFQYSNFILGGSPANNSVSILYSSGTPTGYYQANQTAPSAGISETITLPYADRAEASVNGQLLNELSTIANYNLSNVTNSGPGDASWGFQWNFDIAANSSVDVIKDKHLDLLPIPEPSVVAVLTLGAGGLLLRRRVRA